MEIEIPSNVLVDVLVGKTTLAKAFDLKDDEPLMHALREGWVIESCSLKGGNIEMDEAPKVVLEIAPPFPSVYWPKKKTDE